MVNSISKQIPVQGVCDPRFLKVRDIFQDSFATDQEIGASVSFVLDGKSVVELWGGHYDDARTREWERDTLVNVYSTTKGMVAICGNQLIERGLIELDAPVAKYWPEFAANGKQFVTVRWLLSHQSGLAAIREPMLPDAFYDSKKICDALAAQAPWWTPGDGQGYHAFTYGFLVGELLRRVTGETIGAYFHKNIAAPLSADFFIGLLEEYDARTSITYGVVAGNRPMPHPAPPPGQFAEFVQAVRNPNSMQHAAVFNPAIIPGDVNTRRWRAAEIPSVNGHCSARALARIYGALARGGEIDGIRILEPATIDRARTEEAFGPDRFTIGVPSRYGLGFQLSHDSGEGYARLSPNPYAFGHTGAGGSLGMADPDIKLGFGFTMNFLHPGIVSPTARAMIDAFYAAV